MIAVWGTAKKIYMIYFNNKEKFFARKSPTFCRLSSKVSFDQRESIKEASKSDYDS